MKWLITLSSVPLMVVLFLVIVPLHRLDPFTTLKLFSFITFSRSFPFADWGWASSGIMFGPSFAFESISIQINVPAIFEGNFVTCPGFPCMDPICLMHYMVEGNILRGQADHAREEEGHRKNRVKGDKTGRKHHQGIGKSVAPERTQGGYQGHGRGQN